MASKMRNGGGDKKKVSHGEWNNGVAFDSICSHETHLGSHQTAPIVVITDNASYWLLVLLHSGGCSQSNFL